MPNGFAYVMLALWPIVTIVIFRRFPPGKAVVISLLSGYLVLPPPPAVFDLPLIPLLNKETIPNLSALVVGYLMYGSQMRLMPQSMLGKVLIVLFVLSPLATAMNNAEPIVGGAFFIQGLGIKEGLSMVLTNALRVIPFVLAMNFVTSDKDIRYVMIALLVAGIAYSLPMLLEVRLSPQLNIWIYGYFQHSFDQMIRGDGFRPIVFLEHGLWVAFFTLLAALSSFILLKSDKSRDPKIYLVAGVYLLFILILCKSLGPLLLALVSLPLILFLGVRMQLRVSLILMVLALVYPIMKGNNLLPERAILAKVEQVSLERAQSLQFRLINEAILLERARVKPILGWGTFGRGLVYDQRGRVLSIPDGRWVITLGSFGWVGFIAEFGLLAFPAFMLWFKAQKTNLIARWSGGFVLLLGINLIEMLPNATLTPVTWLISGSILGYATGIQLLKRRGIAMQSVI